MKLIATALFAALLACNATAQVPAEQARERLASAGVTMDAVSLVQYAAQGDTTTVGLLLAAGEPVSAHEALGGVTALYNAAALGQLQVIEQLLSRPRGRRRCWRPCMRAASTSSAACLLLERVRHSPA